MKGTENSIEGFLMDLPMPILPNISREPTRESLIEIHQRISGNAISMASKLRVGYHDYPTIMITTVDYLSQTGHTFVPLHNPNY